MFDPVTILLGIIAAGIVALAVIFWIRSHPMLQAAVDAKLSPAMDARFKALEAALPTKADVEAEKAKLLLQIQPLLDQLHAAEQKIADELAKRGWNVTKP